MKTTDRAIIIGATEVADKNSYEGAECLSCFLFKIKLLSFVY